MYDRPIPYIERIRSYYQALGYGPPYEWAHHADVPFSPLRRPLAQSRIAIVTTAAPYQPDKGDQGPGAPYNAAAKFYTVYSMDSGADPDLRISHVAIDRKHTTAEDIGAYFPLRAMRELAEKGDGGSRRASTARRPTAAGIRRSPSTVRRSCAAARATTSTGSCSFPIARSATRR